MAIAQTEIALPCYNGSSGDGNDWYAYTVMQWNVYYHWFEWMWMIEWMNKYNMKIAIQYTVYVLLWYACACILLYSQCGFHMYVDNS